MGHMKTSLNDLKELARTVNSQSWTDSSDVSNAITRFLVVRTCGYLERTVESCCSAYLKSKSDPRSSSFGNSWFGRGANPSPDKLIALVRKFDVLWSEELEQLMKDDDELLKREISFLVDRRNKIAHGENEGVGLVKALALTDSAEIVGDWFVQTFDPT